MNDERIIAEYRIESAGPLEEAARLIAGEQSSGTFVSVPGETEELKTRHGARIETLEVLDSSESPALPGSRPSGEGRGWKRARLVLSFPLENCGISLVNVWTMVAGNLFELGPLSGCKLVDVTFPEAFRRVYSGPSFGISGTRQVAGVAGRPLIGTIIKPSVGLSPRETAGIVRDLCRAGIDFIKDDELIASPGYSSIEERAEAVMTEIQRHADQTGKKVIYAFNISGEMDEMKRRHDVIQRLGGDCIMISMIALGLAAGIEICRHSGLMVHGHRNGWGIFDRHPLLGMRYAAFQRFWRLAGVDHLHVNGLRNKFCETDASVLESARCCQEPMLGGYQVMPVFSSGQSARQTVDTYRELGNCDLIYLAGGGIMAHPDGPAAGLCSLQEGWEAARLGRSLEDYARDHPALAAALKRY